MNRCVCGAPLFFYEDGYRPAQCGNCARAEAEERRRREQEDEQEEGEE